MDSGVRAPTFHPLDFKPKNFPFLSCVVRPQTRAGREEEEVEAPSPAPGLSSSPGLWTPLFSLGHLTLSHPNCLDMGLLPAAS